MTGTTTRPTVGSLLRAWRERRGLSQLQLSLDAAVSARHVSFVETGRATPTPAMIERLAVHLDVPLRERNQLLLAAGYAPHYGEHPLDAPALRAVSDAFRTLLDAHLPYPALVLDRWWDVLDRNRATDILLDGCAEHLLEPPVNALRLTLHPQGLAPRIDNLGQWRRHLLSQLRARIDRTDDPRLRELYRELSGYPGAEDGVADAADVVVPMRLRIGAQTLSVFGIAASVLSATDVTIDELHIEAFYPADERTARMLRAGVGG
ncbi:helix-turn-helix domain-containing protein [Skermania piniformis]|uniref:Helix-turn-helix transcriptional regulator n=1 Tax=Skermania pinensis TaxID=39122 RepID=A0ABX8S9I6_9ACTN|nr:helix-turn-helix transcriptional regulator [Skermania piniformis]QXQ14523.1 helix-turn-helix transcriptional regulator [Skermania piniformis]